MDLISLILAFVSGFIIAWTLKPDARSKSIRSDALQGHAENPMVNRKRTQMKEQRKRQIVETVDNSGSITAREVEAMFGVSDATATRYLRELTKEGRIQEKGKGRSTHYVL